MSGSRAKRRKGKPKPPGRPTPSPGRPRSVLAWIIVALAGAALAGGAAWLVLRGGGDERAGAPAEKRERTVDPAVYELLEEVQEHLQKRTFDEGLAAVETFLAEHSEDAAAYYARGLLEFGKLNYQAAIDALERAVELDPEHPDAYLKLGTAYSRIGSLDEVERALEKALELRPGLPEARLLLGRNLARQGDLEAARRSFEAVAEERPAESQFELGLLARQAGDLEEAEAAFRRALAVDPKHLGATSNLGQTLKLLGRLEEGDRFLEHHVQLEAERYEYDRLREQTLYDWAEASSFARLAVYELNHQKLDAAERNFRKALEMDESSALAALGLGRTHLEKGELADAARWLVRAKELDPENPGAMFFLGLVRHLEGRPEEARRELVRSRELAPWGAREYLFFGNALLQTGAMPDARLAYEQCLAIDAGYPEAHIKLGLLDYLAGNLAPARSHLEQVLEANPDDIDTRMFLGIVAFRLSDREAARRAFEVALDRHALTHQADAQSEAMLARYADLPESGPALDYYRQLRADRSG